MPADVLTPDELKRLIESAGALRGWDWSRLRVDRDPVPWEYASVARSHLHPEARVLDIGTGGGERFLKLAPHYRLGVGIDRKPGMIGVARENTPADASGRVMFLVMMAQRLSLASASFDVALNRHAPVYPDEVMRILRPGGTFVTQQVGRRNTQSIFSAFGWGSNGEYWERFFAERGQRFEDVARSAERFVAAGCAVVEQREYDVPYFFKDLESLIFWLKWSPLPETLDPERHCAALSDLLHRHTTPRGIGTNEHRELLVVRNRTA